MLKGLAEGLIWGLGYALICLAYGKKGMEARKKLKMHPGRLIVGFGILSFIGVLAIVVSIAFREGMALLFLVFPVAIYFLVFWRIRKNLPDLIEQAEMIQVEDE